MVSFQGRDCIIYDDIADTCISIVKTAVFLKEHGAKRVFAMATHGLFTRENITVSVNCYLYILFAQISDLFLHIFDLYIGYICIGIYINLKTHYV